MGTGYVRQSSADIVNGNDITAGPLNNEFNAIKDAFDGATGHSHDGTVGEGPQIDLTIGVTNILPIFNGGTGATTKEAALINLEAEPKIAVGTTLEYRRGDKTWRDFATDVRLAVLTGYTAGSNAVVAATDTLLQALGKFQGQITATNTTVSGLGTSKANLASPTFTGTPSGPTATAGTNTTQLATTSFVSTAIAAIVQPVAATLSQIWAATTGNLFVSSETINTAQDWVDGGTVSTSFSPNTNLFINYKFVLAANITINQANNVGSRKYGRSGSIRIAQDSTGSRTASWNTFWDFGTAGPPTLSTAPNAVDYVFYQIDDGGTRAICTFRKGT